MQDVLMTILTIVFLVVAFGIFIPYKGFTRKQFALAAVGLFVAMMIVVPKDPKTPTAASAADLEVQAQSATEGIAAKAKPALTTRVEYSRADSEDTLAKIGGKIFDRLNELEPGAYYAAAASSNCDSVETGAVSLSSSKKGAPRWFVDCKNGNRFMISMAEAQQALAKYGAGQLEIGSRAQDCTQTTVAECSLTTAQKSLSKAEAATYCDLFVKEALIGDSDMDWSWDTRMGDNNEVTIARGFKAQNAFGANLKHRYFCTLDAETKRIRSLVIEGPTGINKLI